MELQFRHYGLSLSAGLSLLLVVFLDSTQAAPLPGCANLPRMISLSQLAHGNAKILLEFYEKETNIRDIISESQDNVPATTISGSSPLEKLQSLSGWIQIFTWHLGNVAAFFRAQEISLVELNDTSAPLAQLSRFVNDFLDVPSTAGSPAVVAPPVDDWSRMVYAYDVMFRLWDFLALVEPLLLDLKAQGLCS